MKLARLLQHPDPIVVNHVISVDPNGQKKTACYDLDVEVDDPLKAQMSNFLASTTNQQEIASLDVKIDETTESINQLKTQRDLTLHFSTDSQDFIQEWLRSQRRDLKIITDVTGHPEEERQAAFFLPQALGPGTSGEAPHCQGAAAKAGTGTGAGNPPDLTAQGSPPFFPALEPAPPQPGRGPPAGAQTCRMRGGGVSPVTLCSPALVS